MSDKYTLSTVPRPPKNWVIEIDHILGAETKYRAVKITEEGPVVMSPWYRSKKTALHFARTFDNHNER